MKMRSIILAALLSLTCFGSEPSTDVFGVVTQVTGQATVSDQKAQIGQRVKMGALIKTEAGTVDVQLRSGGSLRVKEFSAMSADEDENGTSLDRGTALFAINRRSSDEQFNVRTPTAVAGVRGTRFSVMSVENGTEVVVLEGVVDVNNKVVDSGKKSLTLSSSGKTVIISAQLTSQEETEILSLPIVAADKFNSENLMKDVEAERERRQVEIFEQLKKRTSVKPTNPSSTERVQLKNGTSMIGWAVSQTSESVIFFDLGKMKYVYLKKSDVAFQEF